MPGLKPLLSVGEALVFARKLSSTLMLDHPRPVKYSADVVRYFTAKTESRKDAQRYFRFSLRNFATSRLCGEIPKTFGCR
jgi:hypothetical protein